jgi:CubicO group peptidase (beta-lactamase class C family)
MHGTDKTARLLRPWSTNHGVARAVSILALLAAACSPSSAPTTEPPESTASTGSDTPRSYVLGDFPPFADRQLPASTAGALQGALDATVEEGTFTGVTAAVIVADRGRWTGAAGAADGIPLTPDSRSPTHSSGKTIVAAQVLRLVEDGKLGLDEQASDHLPPELRFFDANGATIRQALGMRSGIPGLNEDDGYYPAELASTAVEVFRKLPEPEVAPGGDPDYASTNYILLGTIIEHVTGRPLAEVLRSDVLSNPALGGFVYTVDDAMASDGWGVQTTPGSLARWGYELYGGFILSDASLREMTDFDGQWYGLGVMDFSGEYGTLAVGHEGESSVTTCCSLIRLVALPEEGVVISVQAATAATDHPYATYNSQVVRLTQTLRDAARGRVRVSGGRRSRAGLYPHSHPQPTPIAATRELLCRPVARPPAHGRPPGSRRARRMSHRAGSRRR